MAATDQRAAPRGRRPGQGIRRPPDASAPALPPAPPLEGRRQRAHAPGRGLARAGRGPTSPWWRWTRPSPTATSASWAPWPWRTSAALLLTFALEYGQQILTTWLGQRIMFDLRREIFAHLQRQSLRFFDKNPVGRLMTRVTNDVEVLNQLFSSGDRHRLRRRLHPGPSSWASCSGWTGDSPSSPSPSCPSSSWSPSSSGRRSARRTARSASGWPASTRSSRSASPASPWSSCSAGRRRPRTVQPRSTATTWTRTSGPSPTTPSSSPSSSSSPPSPWPSSSSTAAPGSWTGPSPSAWSPLSSCTRGASSAPSRTCPRSTTCSRAPWPARSGSSGCWTPHPTSGTAQTPSPSPSRGAARSSSATSGSPTPARGRRRLGLGPARRLLPRPARGAHRHRRPHRRRQDHAHQPAHALLRAPEGPDPVRRRAHRPGGAAELRERIGLVLQDVFLFSRSVDYNIRLGRDDITTERARQAATRVGANPTSNACRSSTTSPWRARASLSVGQRQLLSFARALAFDPLVLILDEATSSVDSELEAQIQTALETLLQGRTSLVIAHRLSTIQSADRILVFHHGVLRESGTHAELLGRGGLYARLSEYAAAS
jgi:energy-coupling factor transporter ATP-binding protein EcfA2